MSGCQYAGHPWTVLNPLASSSNHIWVCRGRGAKWKPERLVVAGERSKVGVVKERILR